MHGHQLIQSCDPATIDNVFKYFHSNNKEVYRQAIQTLAQQKKLRPDFITKKPVPEQILWLRRQLSLKINAAVAEHLLQIYFIKAREPMLVEFLNTAGIDHDGSGQIEELPTSIDPEKLAKAAELLKQNYGTGLTQLYLHLFQMQTPEGWPELAALLKSDEQLKLDQPQ